MENGGIDSILVRKCIEAATDTIHSVEKWRMQRRSLQRLPSHLASALLHRLLLRRLLSPSLLELFKYTVEQVDLSREKSVDVEWMAYLGAFTDLRSLNVADCIRINNAALWPLAGMTSLRELDLSRCVKVTDDGVAHLLSIAQLEKLSLSQTGLTADGVKLLSALRNLSTLDLGGLPVSDLRLSSLCELTNLEYLDVWGSEVSNEGVAAFKNLTKLRFLNITWTKITKLPYLQSIECLNMSDCDIHSIMEERSDRGNLRKLIVHGSSFLEAEKVFSSIEANSLSFLNLSNTSLSHFGFLSRMGALEHLDLSFSIVQDNDAEVISSIGLHLRHLNLHHTKLGNAGLETLAGHVPNLEILKLSHTFINDFALAYISTMPSLKELDLSNTNIKGLTRQFSNEDVLSLAALQDLKQLESLYLDQTLVNDEAVHALLVLEELSLLSLNNTLVTDKCLEDFSQVKKLTKLSIQGNLLTNGALDSFKPPNTFQVLDLRDCWLLTMDSVTSFKYKHPGIEVRHDPLTQSSVEPNSSHHNSAGSKASKLKQRDQKSSVSPLSFKEDVLDQRIKYSIEELFTLQHLSSPLVPPLDIDIAMSEMD